MTALTVGDLKLKVRRSDRRKSLGLTVERDGSLVVAAPPQVGEAQLERFVKSKRFWLYQKLAAKEALPASLPARKFVTGEGLPYLGRTFRLQLVSDLDAPVKLEGGRFKMRRQDVPAGKEQMIRWYTAHAQPWLSARVQRWASRAHVKPGAVVVQDLGFRWGSCGKGGCLYFHWQSILLPPSIVDYIVVHELIHLREAHHTPAFWRAMERALPEWEQQRRWLAVNGHRFVV